MKAIPEIAKETNEQLYTQTHKNQNGNKICYPKTSEKQHKKRRRRRICNKKVHINSNKQRELWSHTQAIFISFFVYTFFSTFYCTTQILVQSINKKYNRKI